MIFQDHLTNSLFLVLVNSFTQNCQPFFIIRKSFFQFFCNLADIFFSCLFVIREYGNLHLFRSNDLSHSGKQFFRNSTGFISMFFFSTVCNNFIDKFNNLTIYFMRFENSLDHLSFWNLICSCLNHDYFFSCRSNRQFQI